MLAKAFAALNAVEPRWSWWEALVSDHHRQYGLSLTATGVSGEETTNGPDVTVKLKK